MLKLVVACACVAIAVAQSPSPFLPGAYPGQFGQQPYPYHGAPQPYAPRPYQFQPQGIPKGVPPPPGPIPLPAPAPKPRLPIDIVSQQNYPYHPQHSTLIPILRQNQDGEPGGSYKWDFASANGITAYETAEIVPTGPEEAKKSVVGGYDYTSPEGIPVSVTYTANEFGFQPHVTIHLGQHKPDVYHKP